MLSNRKNTLIQLIALITAAALLASCAARETGGTVTADIIDIDAIGSSEVNYETVVCALDDIYRASQTSASVVYPRMMRLSYNGGEPARVDEVFVYNNTFVEEGTVLATVYYDNTLLSAELEKARLAFANDAAALEEGKKERQTNLAAMSAELQNISRGSREDIDTQAELQRLRIEKARCDYDYYLYSTQKSLDGQTEAIALIEEKLAGYQITAPFDGTIVNVTMYSHGDPVEPGDVFMDIYDNSEFRLAISADASAFRYDNQVTVEINNVDEVFTGRVVSDPTAEVTEAGDLRYIIAFDEPPEDFERLSGRRFTVFGRVYEVWDVLSLPYHSVIMEDGKHYVMVVENNTLKKRYIQLGLNNFEKVEVLSGVKPGDHIMD